MTETRNAEKFNEVNQFIESATDKNNPNNVILKIILKDYGDCFYSNHPNLMWNIIRNTTREYESYLRIKSVLE